LTGGSGRAAGRHRLVIVTGMSGAGRTSALKFLEDQGFEAIDNLPIPLIERFVRLEDGLERDLAIGIDSRTRAFDPERLAALVARLDEANPRVTVSLSSATATTRRCSSASPRPAGAIPGRRPPGAGRHRRRAGAPFPLRASATHVIDTTRLALPDLKLLLPAISAARASTRPHGDLRLLRLSPWPAA
jgi:UPF0042 nucleotide-binding protein